VFLFLCGAPSSRENPRKRVGNGNTLRATQPLEKQNRGACWGLSLPLPRVLTKRSKLCCAAAFFHRLDNACTRPNPNEEGERGGNFRDPFMVRITYEGGEVSYFFFGLTLQHFNHSRRVLRFAPQLCTMLAGVLARSSFGGGGGGVVCGLSTYNNTSSVVARGDSGGPSSFRCGSPPGDHHSKRDSGGLGRSSSSAVKRRTSFTTTWKTPRSVPASITSSAARRKQKRRTHLSRTTGGDDSDNDHPFGDGSSGDENNEFPWGWWR